MVTLNNTKLAAQASAWEAACGVKGFKRDLQRCKKHLNGWVNSTVCKIIEDYHLKLPRQRDWCKLRQLGCYNIRIGLEISVITCVRIPSFILKQRDEWGEGTEGCSPAHLTIRTHKGIFSAAFMTLTRRFLSWPRPFWARSHLFHPFSPAAHSCHEDGRWSENGSL